MFRDLIAVAEASDQRPVAPSVLESSANIPPADSGSLAQEIGEWWTRHRRELWASTWVARVPGMGHQWLEVPRWPVWDNPPVVVPILDEVEGEKYSLDYRIFGGRCRNLLYRQSGWPWTAPATGSVERYPAAGLEDPSLQIGPDPDDASIIGFRAGFVMTGEESAWTASTEWGKGASTSYSGNAYGFARASDRTIMGLFEVTGGSGGAEGTEPTWPTVDGETITTSSNEFTYRMHARPLPLAYVTASIKLASILHRARGDGKKCKGDDIKDILALVKGEC